MYRVELNGVTETTVRGFHAIGYIHTPLCSGTLIRNNHSPAFAVTNVGGMTHLGTDQVAQAIWGDDVAGRTKSTRTVPMRIDDDLYNRAVALGNGNFSEGVRIALRSLTL